MWWNITVTLKPETNEEHFSVLTPLATLVEVWSIVTSLPPAGSSGNCNA